MKLIKKIAKFKNLYPIAGIIAGTVILIIYFLVVFMPLFRKNLKYAREERTLINRLKNIEDMFLEKDNLRKRMKAVAEKVAFYEKRCFEVADIPEVLDNLIRISKTSDISFVSIEPQEIVEIDMREEIGRRYLKIPIRLKLEAGYHEFGRFINGVENAERFIIADQFKITANTLNKVKHNIDLIVTTFVLKKDINNDKDTGI